MEAVTFVNGLYLVYRRPPRKCDHRTRKGAPSAQKGTVLKRTIVQFVKRLRPSNKWPVCRRVVRVYVCTRALANVTGVGLQ